MLSPGSHEFLFQREDHSHLSQSGFPFEYTDIPDVPFRSFSLSTEHIKQACAFPPLTINVFLMRKMFYKSVGMSINIRKFQLDRKLTGIVMKIGFHYIRPLGRIGTERISNCVNKSSLTRVVFTHQYVQTSI